MPDYSNFKRQPRQSTSPFDMRGDVDGQGVIGRAHIEGFEQTNTQQLATFGDKFDASMRQNIVGMRSFENHEDDESRGIASTVAHDMFGDMFGILSRNDPFLDKGSKEVKDLIDTVPLHLQKLVYDQNNFEDMVHKAGMIKSEMDDQDAMHTSGFMAQLGYGALAMPFDPTSWFAFGASGAIRATKVAAMMNSTALRRVGTTTASGAVAGGGSEYLIRKASDEDYSGVAMSALFSSGIAGTVHGTIEFIQHNGGKRQKELTERIQNGEIDLAVNPEKVYSAMSELEKSELSVGINRGAAWIASLTTNRITRGIASSPQLQLVMDGFRDKTKNIKATLEMWEHDTGPIGMKDKAGNDVVMDKKNVQDLKYEMVFENVKFDKARIDAYNKYNKAREDLTTEERIATPQLTHEQFATEMKIKTSKIYDDYNNAKTEIAFAMRNDPVEIEAAKVYAQKKVDEAIVKYDLEQKAKDKNYTPPKNEDLTDVELSQRLEDVFGGRDHHERILAGHEDAYFKNESAKKVEDPLANPEYKDKFDDYEIEFFERSNEYYKNKADRMKANGLDEFGSMDSLHYNPRMWHIDKIKGDVTQAELDIETAIRDSMEYKLAVDQAKKNLDEAIAYKNDPAKEGEYKVLLDRLVVAEKQLDDLVATMSSIDKTDIINAQIANNPFHLLIDENVKTFERGGVTYNVGDVITLNAATLGGRVSIRPAQVIGINSDGFPLFMFGSGDLRTLTDEFMWGVEKRDKSQTQREFNRELAKTQSRHNYDGLAEMIPKTEHALYPKDALNDPVLDALWNAAGRPEISNVPILEQNHAAGMSVPYSNKVYVNTVYGKKGNKQTLYHELVHAMTVAQYRVDPRFKADVDGIYDELMIQAEKDGIVSRSPDGKITLLQKGEKHSYGMTNPMEMLAEFFANPEFIAYMKTVSTEYDVKSVTVSTSLFARIMSVLKAQVAKATKAFEKRYGRKSSVKNTAGALLTVMNNHERIVSSVDMYKKRTLSEVESKLLDIAQNERLETIVNSKDFSNMARMSHDQWVQTLHSGGMLKKDIKGFLDGLEKIGQKNKAEDVRFKGQFNLVRPILRKALEKQKKTIDGYNKAELQDELVSLHENGGRQKAGEKQVIDELQQQVDMLKRDTEEMRSRLDDPDPKLESTRAEYEELIKNPKKAAKTVVAKMVSEGSMLQNAKMTTEIPGIFKERSLHIDSSHPDIGKYLHQNEARIQQMYDYKTVGKISTQDIFGTVDRAKYEQHLKENVTTDAEQIKLLGDMFDRGLGTKQMPADPTNGFEIFARTAANFNYLTMGGQFVKYGFAEMGATIHSVGYRAFMEGIPALKTIIKMYKNGEMNKSDMTMLMLSDSGDIYKGNNMAALGDATDISSTFAGEGPGILDKAEGITKRMQQWMHRYSGLEAATVWTKLVLPRAFMNRILQQVDDGKLDGAAVKDLRRWGLSSKDMIDISNENWTRDMKTGKIDDFNLEGWSNQDLAARFQRSIHKMSRDTIMRPDANRLPDWLTNGSSNILIKMARQFMSFMFLSHERLLIRGVNERQAHAAMSAFVSFGFLAMFETAGEIAAVQLGILDEEDTFYTSDDLEKFMKAMMRVATINSYAGIVPTGVDMYDLFFGNDYGDRSGTLGKIAGGPSLRRAAGLVRAASDLLEGKYGTRDQWDSARTAVLFNNMFGMDFISKKKIFNYED